MDDLLAHPFLVSLGLGASAVATGFGVRLAAYQRYLGYRADRDQSFDFSQSDVATVPVELEANGFRWPEDRGKWDTALLELRLDATAIGHFAEPSIEARSRHHYTRQYFERGTSGVRYLNLGTIAADDPQLGQRVWLHGRRLRWSGDARLALSRTVLPAQPRVLVLAPHPDDAEIAAFGLYSSTPGAWVVTVTAGELGVFFPPRSVPERQRRMLTGRLRVWDSLAVPQFGGVSPERALNLCYADSTLEEMFTQPDMPPAGAALHPELLRQFRAANTSPLVSHTNGELTWRALVGDLRAILESVQPDVIAAPHPLLDDHPDHAFSTLALCEALAQSPHAGGQLLLYVVHSRQSSLYPFGPADGIVPPPPHFGGALPFRTLLSRPLGPDAQVWKLPALEAMHDLRAMPVWQSPGWRTLLRSFGGEARGKLTSLGRDPNNLFRRAVRPNEFFFGMPVAEAPALAAETLRAWRAGELAWHRFQ